MVAGLYEALKDAGAKPELAQKAAEEVASYESRLTTIETKLIMIQWMLGINLAMTTGILFALISFAN